MNLTLSIIKGNDFFVGTIKEIPGVVSQGTTIEEAKENTLDALELYLEDMRTDAKEENTVLEEELILN